ncbi:MAG: hypothetical protein GX922_03910 [Firmicutes bacterium]|nr:hypothetical protein [Bacillota bacterium]
MTERKFTTSELEVCLNFQRQIPPDLLTQLYLLRIDETLTNEEKAAKLQEILRNENHAER